MHIETVYFTGHVQGVGFRYSALQVAQEFEVTGRIGNQPDGRVLLEVEGTPREVSAFIGVTNATKLPRNMLYSGLNTNFF